MALSSALIYLWIFGVTRRKRRDATENNFQESKSRNCGCNSYEFFYSPNDLETCRLYISRQDFLCTILCVTAWYFFRNSCSDSVLSMLEIESRRLPSSSGITVNIRTTHKLCATRKSSTSINEQQSKMCFEVGRNGFESRQMHAYFLRKYFDSIGI